MQTYQEMRRILSHSIGDAHLRASSSSSVSHRPKTKAPPREEERCPPLISTILPPNLPSC